MRKYHLNLRLNEIGDALIPAPITQSIIEIGMEPMLLLPQLDTLVCRRGTILVFVNRADGSVICDYDTKRKIKDACALADNVVQVFTDMLSYRFTFKDDLWHSETRAIFPTPLTSKEHSRAVDASVPQRKLSKTYTLTDHSLNVADNASLTSDLLDAYTALREASDAAGVFAQPVITRCRYLDDEGQTVFVTPPKLISPLGGFQCTATVTSSIDNDSAYRGAINLSANTFKIKVEFPAVLCRQVAKVIVEATPQLDMVNFNAMATAAVMRNSDGRLYIRTSLPTAPSSPFGRKSLTNACLEHLETLYSPLTVISNPFNGQKHAVTVGCISTGGTEVKTSIAALRSTISAPAKPAADNGIIGQGAIPHAVSAACHARNGDTILLGDLTVVPFAGYSIDCFAAETADLPWKSSILVEFAGDNNEKVVSYAQGDSGAPLTLNPILSYPRADARKMTVFLQAGGLCYMREFDLKPTINRDMACFVNDNAEPIVMTDHPADFFIVPAENPVVHRYPGTIATASARSPDLPRDFRRVTDNPVTAISHAPGSTSGWDYVRARFYLFSPDGTFTAITDSAGIRNINKVDHRSVSHHANVIPETRQGVTVLTDEGDLLVWQGVAPRIAATSLSGRIAYDAIHNELWLFSRNGNLAGNADSPQPFNPDCSSSPVPFANTVMRSFPGVPAAILHTQLGSVIQTDSALYMLGHEEAIDAVVPVRFIATASIRHNLKGCTLRYRRKAQRLRAFRLNMQSPPTANLDITVEGDHGAGPDNASPLYSFSVKGAINSPLLFHTPAPPFLKLYFSATGSVPVNASFNGFEYFYELQPE